MPVVVTFTVPAAQFPLTRALDPESDVEVGVDRVIAGDGGATPVFWVRGEPAALDDAERAFGRLDDASDLTLIETVAGDHLYRLTWNGPDDDLLSRLGRESGRLLEANGTVAGCELVVQFPDADALESFSDWCAATNLPVENATVHWLDGDVDAGVDLSANENSLRSVLFGENSGGSGFFNRSSVQ